MKRGASIRGRVIDPEGNPATKVYVSIRCGELRGRAHTDADGSFAFDDLDAGSWKLMASSYGRAGDGWWLSAQTQLTADSTVEFELRAPAGVLLAGVVHDESGAPVANVTLSAMSPPESMAVPTVETVETDAEGRFRFRTIPAGPVMLSDDDGRGRLEVVAPDDRVVFKFGS